MTLIPLLQREIDQLVTRQARHAIAQELRIVHRVAQIHRQELADAGDNHIRHGLIQDSQLMSWSRRQALTALARGHFPRVHPAPGRLNWCLVNQHGPVCDNHAIPGSSYCHQHRAYEDAITERKQWS